MSTSKPLHSLHVFRTGTIHGIVELGANDDVEDPGKLLIWGGRSVCVVQLEHYLDQHGVIQWELRLYSSELFLTDWILEAYCHTSTLDKGSKEALPEAFLVTSHDLLLSLSLDHPPHKDSLSFISSTPFARGPHSMLYSAHLVDLDSERLLVASGTVFGEVLLWTCRKYPDPNFDGVQSGRVAFTFSGHEGSVFGVRIADSFTYSDHDVSQRFVVSCSDDRMIKFWDISKIDMQDLSSTERNATDHHTGFQKDSSGDFSQRNQCLATAMGHASRIWGVRFLSRHDRRWQLLSYGEDASSCIWQFDYPTSNVLNSEGPSILELEKVHEYHAGKNIWAVATSSRTDGTCLVSSGGADGQVVLYAVNFDSAQNIENTRIMSKGNDELHSQPWSPVRSAFDAMQGSWDLYRVLKSERPSFPSGFFKGTATLSSRSPTDQSYDGEYLYSEEGILTTEGGLSLKGSRRYVYRYQSKNDTITAWFVKPEDYSSVDYLFHLVEFQKQDAKIYNYEKEQPFLLTAAGHHLCVHDQYDAKYAFIQKSQGLESWSVKYDVKGPQKDYYADATYSRNPVPTRNTSICLKDADPSKPHNRHRANIKEKEDSFIKHKDALQNFSWITDREILATTVQGKVIRGDLKTEDGVKECISERLNQEDVSWTEVAQISDLASHSLVTDLFSSGAALVSGKKGLVYLYIRAQECISPIKTLPGKVSAIFSQELYVCDRGSSSEVVITCLGFQIAYLFVIHSSGEKGHNFSISELTNYELPSRFIVTSAHRIEGENLLALGSRAGNLCLYDTSKSNSDARTLAVSRSLFHVHAEDAITVIQTRSGHSTSSGTIILTAGRDGKYALHRVLASRDSPNLQIEFETLHISKPPFGPNIEGAYFDNQTKDLLLWGFRSTSFVVWNSTRQQELVVIKCGGAHRRWRYRASVKGGNFVWTKASTCNIHLQTQPSHHTLQPGGHGREIKSMAFHRAADGSRIGNLLAIGAEDTAISVWSIGNMSNPPFAGAHLHSILHQHTSGVQQVRFSPNGNLLFSAGSREEFFVWRLTEIRDPAIPLGIILDGACPPVTTASDLRIMDFIVIDVNKWTDSNTDDQLLISIVYSNSSIRVSLPSPLKTIARLPPAIPELSEQTRGMDYKRTRNYHHPRALTQYTEFLLTSPGLAIRHSATRTYRTRPNATNEQLQTNIHRTRER